MEGEQGVDTEDGAEVDVTNAINAMWKRFRSLDVAGNKTLKNRVCEIAYPTTIKMVPPPEKIKTKGGVKRKWKKLVGYDVYHDPSCHEYVDQAHNTYQKSSKRPCSQLSQTSKKKPSNRYIVQFPEHIIQFIDDIVDVKRERSCGYRMIASMYGYGEDGWSMVRRDLNN
ncbi:unnamed protein product [Lathyrus sativus]|nr:unnamed protein product [Lathyrus sativus]